MLFLGWIAISHTFIVASTGLTPRSDANLTNRSIEIFVLRFTFPLAHASFNQGRRFYTIAVNES